MNVFLFTLRSKHNFIYLNEIRHLDFEVYEFYLLITVSISTVFSVIMMLEMVIIFPN